MSTTKRDWQAYGIDGVFLRFLVHENRRFEGRLVYEWLLQTAKHLGIHGGSAYRGIAGFGRHGILHEEHFFELAGDLPVEIGFVCGEDEANRLLDAVENAELSLFYVIGPIRYGVAGLKKADWPSALPPAT